MAELAIWRAGLMRLGYTLLVEASETPGKWRAYQLKDSPVLVSCRMVGSVYQMRIAKPDREHGDQWRRELVAMETFLGLVGWRKYTDAHAKGMATIYETPGDPAAMKPDPQETVTAHAVPAHGSPADLEARKAATLTALRGEA